MIRSSAHVFADMRNSATIAEEEASEGYPLLARLFLLAIKDLIKEAEQQLDCEIKAQRAEEAFGAQEA